MLVRKLADHGALAGKLSERTLYARIDQFDRPPLGDIVRMIRSFASLHWQHLKLLRLKRCACCNHTETLECPDLDYLKGVMGGPGVIMPARSSFRC